MITKKLFHWMFLGTLTMGVCAGFASCSDDDDDVDKETMAEKAALDPYEKSSEEAVALYRIVHKLCATDSLPDSWKTATYAPIEGKVTDASQPLVRSVAVSGAEEARLYYESLAGQDLAQGATTGKWEMKGVGTMTYTELNQSNCVATIDFNIGQMHGLAQLKLVPAGTMGENAHFEGNAYYRIGDVVKDKDERYWVCVRSAYSSADKDKTYWVTTKLLDKKSRVTGMKGNLQTYKETKKRGLHVVPTNLGGDEKRMMKYFAQLMYFIQNPEEYSKNAQNNGVVKNGLGDLGTAAHNEGYVRALSRYWKANENLWQNVLSPNTPEDYFNKTQTGVNIFYEGYSSPLASSNMTLTLATLSGPCLSNITTTHPKWDMDGGTGVKFDIREYANTRESGAGTTVGGVSHALVCCVATGEELNGRSIKPTEAIRAERVEEVFNANKVLGTATQLAEPKVGCILAKDGNFYTNCMACALNNTDPLAMVVYLGDKNRVEAGKDFNGLAMALKDMEWQDKNTFYWSTLNKDTIVSSVAVGDSLLIYRMDGLAKTWRMNDYSHPAAKTISSDIDQPLYKLDDKKFSHWFIPSTGQCILAMKGMGYSWKRRETPLFGGYPYEFSGGKWLWAEAGAPEAEIAADGFWTSTEAGEDGSFFVYRFNGKAFSKDGKKNLRLVRPMIAFKYGNGGSIEPENIIKPTTNPAKGNFMGSDGKIYANRGIASSATGYEPAALVVFYGPKNMVEKNTDYRGLAIPFVTGSEKYKWAENKEVCQPQKEEFYYDNNGIKWTTQLIAGCNQQHEHPVFKNIENFEGKYSKVLTKKLRQANNISDFFIGSCGQWCTMLESYFTISHTKGIFNDANNAYQTKIWPVYNTGELGGIYRDGRPNEIYWTSTEKDKDNAYVIIIKDNTEIKFEVRDKSETHPFFPFIAF